MKTRPFLQLIIVALVAASCNNKATTSNGTPSVQLRPFTVKLDWVPSPEYYGFYYAQRKNFYRDAGLAVTIQNGSGAPSVAKELAVGAIYAGTTTSDNLLREVSNGAQIARAVPILRFNPCVLAVRAGSSIRTLQDVKMKTIGTNKQASVYSQFLRLLQNNGLKSASFKEYPIGWGGAVQLKQGVVDGILAYTTNVVVDLETEAVPVREFYFGSHGLESFGLVLAVSKGNDKADITEQDIDRFIEATMRGYEEGARDIEGSVRALQSAAPTLDRKKLSLAITKIQRLNSTTNYPLDRVDAWVTGPRIGDDDRRTLQSLFSKAPKGY